MGVEQQLRMEVAEMLVMAAVPSPGASLHTSALLQQGRQWAAAFRVLQGLARVLLAHARPGHAVAAGAAAPRPVSADLLGDTPIPRAATQSARRSRPSTSSHRHRCAACFDCGWLTQAMQCIMTLR